FRRVGVQNGARVREREAALRFGRRAHERALSHVPPDHPLAFKLRQGGPEPAAGQVQVFGELALGGQLFVGPETALPQVVAQDLDGGLPGIGSFIHSPNINQFGANDKTRRAAMVAWPDSGLRRLSRRRQACQSACLPVRAKTGSPLLARSPSAPR